ncbi:MAG: hypothetical protein OXB88_09025 [Bacteriovoracales bacterium]|nr:hypothetical protein [Bacteriovoracales bacterium]
MGKIGDILPKPLWPVFEKTLLELQFDFYHWTGAKRKFINIHHQAKKIEKFVANHLPEVKCLYEKNLLGVGGGILNLKNNYPKLNSVLISNVDQFFFISQEKIKNEINQLYDFDAILFALPVCRSQGYNQLEISKEGQLLGINSNPSIDRYLTYSGVALINCSTIKDETKAIGLFKSIADPKKRRVKVVNGEGPYYDLGTIDLYIKQFISLLEQMKKKESGDFFEFLKKVKGVNVERMSASFNSDHSKNINEYCFRDLKITMDNEAFKLESDKLIDLYEAE